MAKENFNKRTRELFESQGWIYEKTEHFNAYGGVTVDFGGFADAIVYSPIHSIKNIALQITDESNWTHRKKKIIGKHRALGWVLAGNTIMIIAWKVEFKKQRDARGALRDMKHYGYQLRTVTLGDFQQCQSNDLVRPTVEDVGGYQTGLYLSLKNGFLNLNTKEQDGKGNKA